MYALLVYVGTFGLTQVAPPYHMGKKRYTLSATTPRSYIME